MEKPKTHYRKVFKSDHLGVADLEDLLGTGSNLIFTINHVNQEIGVMVAGRKGNHNIAYFKEGIKPFVLNATNSKIMKSFANGSSFVEDWNDIPVQLYIDYNVKMKGDVVGGVRINPQKPRMQKPALVPENKTQWDNAIAAYKRDGNLDKVKARVDISPENEKALIEQAKPKDEKNVA